MLRVENVTKSFGGLMAVNNVSLELNNIGITGLIGPNGSGKTTLFHTITGFYTMNEGHIFFDGEEISRLPAYRISKKGLIRTFQQTRTLPFLSTLDNLLSASPDQLGEHLRSIFLHPRRIRKEERDNRERAEEILETLDLKMLRDEPAGHLSFGQQKLVELGRVLMTQPKMILLDEPTAGINPVLIAQLSEIIKKLSRDGTQVFLIEHNMPFVNRLCELVFVMDSGNLIFSGTPDRAREDDRVIEAYLGRDSHVA